MSRSEREKDALRRQCNELGALLAAAATRVGGEIVVSRSMFAHVADRFAAGAIELDIQIADDALIIRTKAAEGTEE